MRYHRVPVELAATKLMIMSKHNNTGKGTCDTQSPELIELTTFYDAIDSTCDTPMVYFTGINNIII